MYKLGVSDKWNVVDIFGLEPEMLEWVPKPVKAVILLFPCSEAVSTILYMYCHNITVIFYTHSMKIIVQPKMLLCKQIHQKSMTICFS